MFAGPSGIGKTTMAQVVSRDYDIPFYSGSMRDLMPDMKEVTHSDMLKEDKTVQYQNDFQLLNLRNKKFGNLDSFVTDRSYLDSAAYFIYKQSSFQPQCEVDNFLDSHPKNIELIKTKAHTNLQKGDVVLFHCKTLHHASKNVTDKAKISFVYTARASSNKPTNNTRSDFKEVILD